MIPPLDIMFHLVQVFVDIAGTGIHVEAELYTHGYVIVTSEQFLKILEYLKRESVVLVHERKGLLTKRVEYIYVTKYGEFVVITCTETPLMLPSDINVIRVKSLELPSRVLIALSKVRKRTRQ